MLSHVSYYYNKFLYKIELFLSHFMKEMFFLQMKVGSKNEHIWNLYLSFPVKTYTRNLNNSTFRPKFESKEWTDSKNISNVDI